MRWALNLYTTEKTRKKLPRLMQKLRWRRPVLGVYFITLASNEKNLLDIFHGTMYLQKAYRNMNPDIVGVAEDYEEALAMTARITSDVLLETRELDIRSYFRFE